MDDLNKILEKTDLNDPWYLKPGKEKVFELIKLKVAPSASKEEWELLKKWYGRGTYTFDNFELPEDEIYYDLPSPTPYNFNEFLAKFGYPTKTNILERTYQDQRKIIRLKSAFWMLANSDFSALGEVIKHYPTFSNLFKELSGGPHPITTQKIYVELGRFMPGYLFTEHYLHNFVVSEIISTFTKQPDGKVVVGYMSRFEENPEKWLKSFLLQRFGEQKVSGGEDLSVLLGLSRPGQMKSIFVCHSSKDERLVNVFFQALKKMFGNDADIFVATEPGKIPPGKDWLEKIEEKLLGFDVLTVLITENSLKSNWVWFECGASWLKKLKVNCEIMPICFAGADKKKVPNPLH